MTTGMRGLLAMAVVVAAAGCAQPPEAQAPVAPAAPAVPPLAAMPDADCGELRFEQSGRMVRANGRSVTLDREPFTVHFTGTAGGASWLHAMASESVLARMEGARQGQLWLVDGLGIAAGREDELWLASEAQVAGGPEGQRSIAEAVGPNYFAVFREASARHPQARYLAVLPFNVVRTTAAWTGRPALRVNSIQGRPVMQTRYRQLHFVALSVLDRFTVPPNHRLSLYRVGWSACTVVFRGS